MKQKPKTEWRYRLYIVFFTVCQIGFAMLQSGASRVESAAVPFVTNVLVFGKIIYFDKHLCCNNQ